jgi:hypothetical protein
MCDVMTAWRVSAGRAVSLKAPRKVSSGARRSESGLFTRVVFWDAVLLGSHLSEVSMARTVSSKGPAKSSGRSLQPIRPRVECPPRVHGPAALGWSAGAQFCRTLFYRSSPLAFSFRFSSSYPSCASREADLICCPAFRAAFPNSLAAFSEASSAFLAASPTFSLFLCVHAPIPKASKRINTPL